jgi:DNA-binding MarR family transcriptional regulator
VQSVSRVPAPGDARARIVELTARGRHVLRVMYSSAKELESQWENTVGRRQLTELRESLQLLLAARSRTADG